MPTKVSLLLPILLSGLFVGVTARADDHSVVAPYVADDVAAMAYLDLRKVDLAALLNEMQTLRAIPPGLAEDRSGQVAVLQNGLRQLVEQGATRVYWLWRMTDVQYAGPCWVIPLSDDADPTALLHLLPPLLKHPLLPNEFRRVDGALLAARDKEQLAQLTTTRAVSDRKDLTAALKALGQADAGLIVLGDADSRRVLREMFPAMPEPFQAIDGRMIADELRWGGFAIDLPPEPKLVMHVETSRPETATTIQDTAVKLIELAKSRLLTSLAKESPDVRVLLSQLFGLIQPRVNGAAVTLSLADDAEEVARMREVVAPLLAAARGPVERKQRINQLRQLALAYVNYESAHGSLIETASYDESGQPLLSWRVHLLPFLEQEALYGEFHLDEPWDSPHNRQLIARIPDVYADPGRELRKAIGVGRTTFVAPVAVSTLFPPRAALPDGKPLKLRDIKDGTSKTILFVEVVPDRAVVWTQPDDWQVNLDHPLQGLLAPARKGFVAAFADGHVRYFEDDVAADQLLARLTRAGGEPTD